VSDVILDASVTLALCFPEERTPALLSLQESLATRSAVVPPLWWYEVANALLQAKRRARLPEGGYEAVLPIIRELSLITDDQHAESLFQGVISLAERFRLTVYDATYLELASRRGLPLATLDVELRTAATSLGVPLEPI
jgi:predicted nucleic acid-binding protein